MARTCPECGSSNVAEIVYGLPGPELVEAYERGEVVLGGCCISVDERGESAMSDRTCRDYGHDFTAPRRRPTLA